MHALHAGGSIDVGGNGSIRCGHSVAVTARSDMPLVLAICSKADHVAAGMALDGGDVNARPKGGQQRGCVVHGSGIEGEGVH